MFLKEIDAIREITNSEGVDIKIWGSSELVELLFEHDLVTKLWLNIHPVVESKLTSTSVFIENYRKAGEIKTGKVGPESEYYSANPNLSSLLLIKTFITCRDSTYISGLTKRND